jgi:hypothetical protein
MLYSTKQCTDLLTLLAIFIFGTGACTWGVLYPSGVNKGHGCRSPWPFFVLKAMGKPMAFLFARRSCVACEMISRRGYEEPEIGKAERQRANRRSC